MVPPFRQILDPPLFGGENQQALKIIPIYKKADRNDGNAA